ncbi:hypothetical protein CYMTET_19669 [Cymbomonas tetramitiformis]|uniref:Secreted protein n=1 Tax=Cymbomonas tetramitiformis TaxID=36881 RepID=A0AAE0G5N9_9CHLO|nr:hypothetical protein CYMTET_19669 [Cymbomonas tetramitiformis]
MAMTMTMFAIAIVSLDFVTRDADVNTMRCRLRGWRAGAGAAGSAARRDCDIGLFVFLKGVTPCLTMLSDDAESDARARALSDDAEGEARP